MEEITTKRVKTAATAASLAEGLSPFSQLGSWHHVSDTTSLRMGLQKLKDVLTARHLGLSKSRERQWQSRITTLLIQAAGLLANCSPHETAPCQHQKSLQAPIHALLVALHGVPNATSNPQLRSATQKAAARRTSRKLNWTHLIEATRQLQAAVKGRTIGGTPAYKLADTNNWDNIADALSPSPYSVSWATALATPPEQLAILSPTSTANKATKKSKTNPAQKEPMTATKAPKAPRKTAAKKAPPKPVVSALSEEQFFRLLHSGAIVLSIDSTSTETLHVNIKDPLKALGISTGAPTVSPATTAANPLIKATRNPQGPLPLALLSHPLFEDPTAYDTFLEQQSVLAFEAYVIAAKTPRQTISNAFSAWMTAQYKLVLKQELAPVTGIQIMSLTAAEKRSATALFDLVSNPN